jgi:AAA15 family ATPase/GTPase
MVFGWIWLRGTMRVTEMGFLNFKLIEDVTVPVSRVTVLVGGNNSGKTCVLQAAHFGISLAQTQVVESSAGFPPEKLRYSPTADFLDLPYGNACLTTQK